jgi:WD40 repeat protein
LVSAPFLASDFIMEQELPALAEKGVPLIPVLVRPCLWTMVPALAGLQWAHDPGRDGALAVCADPEGQIVRVCLALAGLLADADGTDDAAPAEPSRQSVTERVKVRDSRPAPAVSAVPSPSDARLGRLDGVPGLPRGFVSRPELDGLRQVVLGPDGAAGVTGRALGMAGQGGIGKTVLAAALARDDSIRRHFPDGVFWVTVGEQADLVASQIALLERIGVPRPQLRSAAEGAQALREALAGQQCLLVADDVWSAEAAMAFRVTGPQGRVLYTSRDPAALRDVAAAVTTIGVLSREAAVELLAAVTGIRTPPPDEAGRICSAAGYVALAVALAGATIGGGSSWPQVAGDMEAGAGTFLDHPYAATFKAMQVGVAALDADDAHAYGTLAVYPGDTVIPVEAVARLWSHLYGSSRQQARARLDRLIALNLLSAHPGGIAFHGLQREFLLLKASDLRARHAELLTAYRCLLPSGSGWADLPLDEPYIWDHVLFHLRGVGDGAGIRALACDLAWIVMRCFTSGPYAAETDLRLAASLYPEDPAIGWLLRLLAQSSHLLAPSSQPSARPPAPADLAVTLASRLRDAPAPLDKHALSSLLPRHYLTPAWDWPTQPSLNRVLAAHTGAVDAVAFSPDGRRLASAEGASKVQLWDPDTGQLIATLDSQAGPVHAVAFSPDGRHLAAGLYRGMVRLWDPDTGQLTATLPGHVGRVHTVAFSPDGRRLASGDDDTVRLWDPDSGQPAATLAGGSPVNAVAFSPDGRLLASCGFDNTVRLWDPDTGQLTSTRRGHADAVVTLAFSPDGRCLASGGSDKTVRLWDLTAGPAAANREGHDGPVNAIAVSPDGRLLASGGDDRTVRLWDPATGRLTATLEGHTGGVYTVACSPDGRQMASGGFDMVRLWEPVTGRLAATLPGDLMMVRSVAFSPDGRLLASGDFSDTVYLWDPVLGKLTATLRNDPDTVLSVAFPPMADSLPSAAKTAA